MGAVELKKNLYWVGALDPELRVFDVVMRTEFGTTYNAYLLKTGSANILFETVKAKFFDVFLSNLSEVCAPADLDYIVVDHTEPDHAGSLERLLSMAPKAKVLASQVAINFLRDICNRDIPARAVSDGDVLEVGGERLRFLSVPFLHWPDSIYTYIEGMRTLVSCDSFGCHYSDPRITNDRVKGDFEPAYHYYFNMIMGPFKKHVRHALERIKPLEIKMICPGHGPVLVENLEYYTGLYEKWSAEPEPEARKSPKVVVAYVSAYGYTEEIAKAIAAAVREKAGADVSMFDMVKADSGAVAAELASADGILLGSPTVNGDALPPVMNLAMGLNGVLHGGKVAGAFGSYGWSGEAADMLMSRLSLTRMKTVEPALKFKFKPSTSDLDAAKAYGAKFAKKLSAEWASSQVKGVGGTKWRCVVCGEVFDGPMPPLSCPVCGAGQEAFVEYAPEVVSFRSEASIRVVVIGAGAGGVAAATAVRKRCPNAEIDVYTRERVMPYYRPALTKNMADKADAALSLLNPDFFYIQSGIRIHLGASAVEIDRAGRNVRFADGSNTAYDKLVLATGASSFVPPIPGASLPQVVAPREADDFRRLETLLSDGVKRVVVLGGGLLGLETACALSKMGHNITVLEACPGILPRQMDAEGSRMLEGYIRKGRAKVVTGVYAEEILGHDRVHGVKAKDGRVFDCDIVVVSVGMRSNVELAKAAGLKIDRAIVVDERMRTSDLDIHAVGDCASFNGSCDCVWETAMEHGRAAGAAVAGDYAPYKPKLLGFTLHAFLTQVFSIGDLGKGVGGGYQQVEKLDELAGTYQNIYFKDGRATGGILLGDVSKTNALLSCVVAAATAEDARDAKLL